MPFPFWQETLGLPVDAVVFASFNNVRKVSRDAFEVWARILKRTPNVRM